MVLLALCRNMGNIDLEIPPLGSDGEHAVPQRKTSHERQGEESAVYGVLPMA